MTTPLKIVLWVIGIYLLIGIAFYVFTISNSYVADPRADCLELKNFQESFNDEDLVALNCDNFESTSENPTIIEKFKKNSSPSQAFHEIVQWPFVVMRYLFFEGIICFHEGRMIECE